MPTIYDHDLRWFVQHPTASPIVINAARCPLNGPAYPSHMMPS